MLAPRPETYVFLSFRRKLPGSFFSVFYMHKVAQFFFSFRSVFNQFSADGPELENRQKTVSFFTSFPKRHVQFFTSFDVSSFFTSFHQSQPPAVNHPSKNMPNMSPLLRHPHNITQRAEQKTGRKLAKNLQKTVNNYVFTQWAMTIFNKLLISNTRYMTLGPKFYKKNLFRP